jgi:hypothetical protein
MANVNEYAPISKTDIVVSKPRMISHLFLKYLFNIFAMTRAKVAISEKLKIVDARPASRLNPTVTKAWIE